MKRYQKSHWHLDNKWVKSLIFWEHPVFSSFFLFFRLLCHENWDRMLKYCMQPLFVVIQRSIKIKKYCICICICICVCICICMKTHLHIICIIFYRIIDAFLSIHHFGIDQSIYLSIYVFMIQSYVLTYLSIYYLFIYLHISYLVQLSIYQYITAFYIVNPNLGLERRLCHSIWDILSFSVLLFNSWEMVSLRVERSRERVRVRGWLLVPGNLG